MPPAAGDAADIGDCVCAVTPRRNVFGEGGGGRTVGRQSNVKEKVVVRHVNVQRKGQAKIVLDPTIYGITRQGGERIELISACRSLW